MKRTLALWRAANTPGISLPEPRSSASPLIASMCSTPLFSSRQSIVYGVSVSCAATSSARQLPL